MSSSSLSRELQSEITSNTRTQQKQDWLSIGRCRMPNSSLN